MDSMFREDLQALLRAPDEPCVSIYMPTHGEASWVEHDRLVLKNLIGEAAKLLESGGMRRPDIERLLEPAKALVLDSFFWQAMGRGLAIFASAESFRRFRLPISFKQQAYVDRRWHIRPLLNLFSDWNEFFVLSLGTKGAGLYRVTPFGYRKEAMPAAPKSLEDELRFDDFEKHVEFRTGAPAGGGGPTATFFGHGGIAEHLKEELRRYLHDIDFGLRTALRGEHKPVVLAGVRYLQAMFAQISTCRHLVEDGVVGSLEQIGEADMIERAREVVREKMPSPAGEAVHAYRVGRDKGTASDDPKEVFSAARNGRVETLLAARDRELFGSVFPSTGAVEVHAAPRQDDVDLAELAAAATLEHGGDVFAVEPEDLPEGVALAAVYRY